MSRKSLIEQLPLAPFAALLMGGSVAFFFLAMPIALIERAVLAIGLPSLLAAAAPPLGGTARLLVASVAALAMAAITWIAITLSGALFEPRHRKPRAARRADAHPDAPTRKPIFASSDFALPVEPEEMIAPVEPADAEWAEIAAVEADDTLELVDIVAEDEAPQATAEPLAMPPSIASLMARLEAGAERRAAMKAAVARRPAPIFTPAPPANGRELDSALRTALDELQRMATR